MRLTVVTNIPTEYRNPLFDEIHRLLVSDGGELTVLFGGESEKDRQWARPIAAGGGWSKAQVPHAQLHLGNHATYANPYVARMVAKSKPDVVVVGGYAPWTFAIVAWCWLTKTPYLVWSGETTFSAGRNRSARWRRQPIARLADGALAYGPAAAEYLQTLAFDSKRTTIVGNCIDIDSYRSRVTTARRSESDLAARIGIVGGNRILLSVGGKGISSVQAVADQLDDDIRIVICGTEQGSAGPRVIRVGKVSSDEMPDLYALADCVVHTPSIDQWPHAINESLSAGIPVVASPNTGVPDSILTGPGCAIVDPEDQSALLRAIAHGLEVGTSSDQSIRDAITEPLREWDVPRMAERFVNAAEQACS